MSEPPSALTSTGAIPPGVRLGKYEVLGRLRSGGMAEIYIARAHGAADVTQLVVIKRILPHLAEDPDFVRMFLNEAKITASLDHPHIAHVKEVGSAGGSFFLALEFVHGVDLRQLLRRVATEGPIPLGPALGIILTCADALHYAHERAIVHRDMSPSNVMVTYHGHVKVLDFGIAKAVLTAMTRTGTIKGKVGYMSPEQCMAEDIDRRSDVFSLGVLLYETTVGKRLFKGDSDFAIMNQIMLGRVVPPRRVDATYPEALEEIVLKAIAVSPDDRYPSADALGQSIAEFARQQELEVGTGAVAAWMRGLYPEIPPPVTEAELSALPAPASQRLIPTKWTLPGSRGRRRAWTIGVAGTALGVAVGAAVMGALQSPTPNPTDRAAPAHPSGVAEAPRGRVEVADPSGPVTAEANAGLAHDAAPPLREPAADEPSTLPSAAVAAPADARAKPSSKKRKRNKKKRRAKPSRAELFPPSRGGR